MKISRFQLKLTAAFVGLLLIPTLLLGWVGGKLLTRALDLLVGQKVERALDRSLTMVQRMRDVEEEAIRSVLGEIVARAEAGDPLEECLEEMRETYRLDSAQTIGDLESFGRLFAGERKVSSDPWVVMDGDLLRGTILLDSAPGGGGSSFPRRWIPTCSLGSRMSRRRLAFTGGWDPCRSRVAPSLRWRPSGPWCC
ncbi:MAG: hypothetical protein V1800_16345 [Candidatus Latescibacterota bacterium]